MLRRALALIFLAWIAGFLWFSLALPRPLGDARTQAVVVLTGGEGRIARGLQALEQGWADRMLVSGVDREVRPGEFASEYRVSPRLMECCVTLGFDSWDTRSNAAEVARWLAAERFTTVRLVTTDWHMRRAALELERMVPQNVTIQRDAVTSRPSLRTLFLEYHKLLARRLSLLWAGA